MEAWGKAVCPRSEAESFQVLSLPAGAQAASPGFVSAFGDDYSRCPDTESPGQKRDAGLPAKLLLTSWQTE